MCCRGVWIYKLDNLSKGTQIISDASVLFHKKFPTVELRVKKFLIERYVPLPSDVKLGNLLLSQLEPRFYDPKSPSLTSIDYSPVHSVNADDGGKPIWPFVLVRQKDLLFVCLADPGNSQSFQIFDNSSIPTCLSFIDGMIEFLKPLDFNVDKHSSQFLNLHLYISEAATFGTPFDTNPETARLKLSSNYLSKVPVTTDKTKHPVWKPKLHHGKSTLTLQVNEHIKCTLYDRSDCADQWEVYGCVVCRAELEGVLTEVTLCLGHVEGSCRSRLQHVSTHQCVQSVNRPEQRFQTESSNTPTQCKLRFTPPLQQFNLALYTSDVPQLPLMAFYQMKGERSVEVLFQIKLADLSPNEFEYLEVHMPFYNRGSIQKFESTQSQGSTRLSSNKTTFVWSLGSKFTSRSREASLKASLTFTSISASPSSKSASVDETFCSGLKSFAKVYFLINNYTLSGIGIDQHSVQISPNQTTKINLSRSFTSSEFKVWNSHGECLYIPQSPV